MGVSFIISLLSYFPHPILSHRSVPLTGLLTRNLLRLRLLLTEECREPGERFARNNDRGSQSRLSVCDQTLAANLLHLPLIRAQNVVLALTPLLQREEDDKLRILVELAGGLLDHGELGVDARERAVTDGIGLLDVGGDIFVGTRENVDEGLAEFLVAGRCEVERLGAVWVFLEGGDAVADDGVGVEVLRGLSVDCFGGMVVRGRGSYLRRGRRMRGLRFR